MRQRYTVLAESACAFFAQVMRALDLSLCFCFSYLPVLDGGGDGFWSLFGNFCFLTKNGSNAESHPREAAPALHRPPTSAAGARVPDNLTLVYVP